MGYDVSGKIALVTGANRGIGEAIVGALVAAGVRKVTLLPAASGPRPAAARDGSRVVLLPARRDERGAGRHRRGDRDSRRPPGRTTPASSASSVATSRIRNGSRVVDRRRKRTSSALSRSRRPSRQDSRRMAAAPSPTSTRWPRSSASRFSRPTAPRRPRRTPHAGYLRDATGTEHAGVRRVSGPD